MENLCYKKDKVDSLLFLFWWIMIIKMKIEID